MKRVFPLIVCFVMIASAFVLSSCDIVSDLSNAVRYPETYSLSYEITTEEGTIFTVTKTVDSDGNVYYRNADEETIYILEGSGYIRYENNNDGRFEKTSGVKLTKSVVETETAGINEYAEKSKDKFIPTASKESDTEKLGRVCEVFKLGVGTEDNSSYTYYYVDKETGICLGIETKNTALGTSLPHNGEGFICVSFELENVQDVSALIAE